VIAVEVIIAVKPTAVAAAVHVVVGGQQESLSLLVWQLLLLPAFLQSHAWYQLQILSQRCYLLQK
jgi:hypothetical protein